jgi:hypothetical protein
MGIFWLLLLKLEISYYRVIIYNISMDFWVFLKRNVFEDYIFA